MLNKKIDLKKQKTTKISVSPEKREDNEIIINLQNQ